MVHHGTSSTVFYLSVVHNLFSVLCSHGHSPLRHVLLHVLPIAANAHKLQLPQQIKFCKPMLHHVSRFQLSRKYYAAVQSLIIFRIMSAGEQFAALLIMHVPMYNSSS